MQKEDLLSQIAEVTQFVREKAEQNSQTSEDRSGETKEMIERLSGQVSNLLEQGKKNQPYPSGAPISDDTALLIERGMFNGRTPAPYQRMMSASPNHPLVRGTSEAEDMKVGQDLHDATAFRYHALNARMDSTMAIDRLSKHPDTRQWARWLAKHGYIKDVETFLNPKSGQLAEVAMTRNNEVLSPQNTTLGLNNLTFTLVSGQLIDQIYVELIIVNNCTKIPLTRSSMKFPRLTGLTQGVWGGGATGVVDNTEAPAQGGTTQLPANVGFMPDVSYFQKPTISSLQFDAEHILSFLLFNDDMLEDSIIPWLPFCRNELAKNIARAMDDATYNGNSTGTNQDGHEATNHARNAVDGIRYMCGGAPATGWKNATPVYTGGNMVDGGNAALSLTTLETAIKQMGKYALQPQNCVVAVRVADYLRVMMLAEFKLWTNSGAALSLHNGVVGSLYGMDVVPTDIIPLFNEFGCLNAGPGGNGTEDRGSAMIWRRDQVLVGMFDSVQVESTRWAPRLVTILQADVRFDVQMPVGATTDQGQNGGWPYVNILNLVK